MSISNVKTGDIIEVEKKGRKFYAMVTGLAPRMVSFDPIEKNVSYRNCTSNEVVGHWRRSKTNA